MRHTCPQRQHTKRLPSLMMMFAMSFLAPQTPELVWGEAEGLHLSPMLLDVLYQARLMFRVPDQIVPALAQLHLQ